MRDEREKLNDFQIENLGLSSPFMSGILGWPALFLFDGPGGLDGGLNHK